MAIINRPAQVLTSPSGEVGNKWDGVKAAKPEYPLPTPGDYELEIVSTVDARNPSNGNETFKILAAVVATSSPDFKSGDMVLIIQSSKTQKGMGAVKAFVMAAAGYTDEGEYAAFDPHGRFILSCGGAPTEYTKSLAGRRVYATITRGKEIAKEDGTVDYYRNYIFYPKEADVQPRLTK